MSVSKPQIRFSVVLFDGFELLDVFGPVQLFSGVPEITVEFVGPTAGHVASSAGVEVIAKKEYVQVDSGAVLLVPGGMGTRKLVEDHKFLGWLHDAGTQAPLVTSVCTGSALLAAAGLLEGYRATSNKRSFAWATGFGNAVEWQPSARWVHDRDRWTSSGVAAGMDMAAALIADLVGEKQAVEATRRAEYEPHRDSAWDPFASLNGLC